MVAVRRDEHLGLLPEPAKRRRVNYAVAIALKGVTRAAIVAWALRVQAASRTRRVGCE